MELADRPSTLGALKELTLVVFTTQWCPYSLIARPSAKRAALQIGCDIRLVDTEAEGDFARECKIETVPTVLMCQSGQVIIRWEGQCNPEDIPEFFEDACTRNNIKKDLGS